MITIAIIDDHFFIRAALKKLLEDVPKIKVIAEASTGEEALRALQKIKPKVVLLDIDLPDLTGLEIARRLLHYDATLRIIIITGYASDIFSSRVLQMGIAGYLLKESDPEQLIEAIRQVHQGKQYLSPAIAAQIALRKIDNKPCKLDVLTDRELELMILVARGDNVLNIGEKLHLNRETTNRYRTIIFKKLGIKNNVDLTHLALEYRLIQSETLE